MARVQAQARAHHGRGVKIAGASRAVLGMLIVHLEQAGEPGRGAAHPCMRHLHSISLSEHQAVQVAAAALNWQHDS